MKYKELPSRDPQILVLLHVWGERPNIYVCNNFFLRLEWKGDHARIRYLGAVMSLYHRLVLPPTDRRSRNNATYEREKVEAEKRVQKISKLKVYLHGRVWQKIEK